MEPIKQILTVQDYNAYVGVKTLHPLVSVVDMSTIEPLFFKKAYYGLYCVFLKNVMCGPLRYGNKYYDYQDGTVIAMAPGQVYGVESEEPIRPSGWSLVFHPDLLLGNALSKTMRDYHFFAYDNNEALHVSQREREQIEACFKSLKDELELPIDKHTQRVVCRGIGLLLDYCLRYYDRQFITRHRVNSNLLNRFESQLDHYIHGDQMSRQGFPTVAYFADKLCLSPNYFGDLVKKEIGIPPKEYIQQKVIARAKELLMASDEPVNLVAEKLGFDYANHFSRMFKKVVGSSPTEFRAYN